MAPPIIELRGVHKRFGEQEVLRGIDLEVEAGTTLVILGVSGSGKSVLLKHMIGLYRPDQGQVRVDGQDLALLDPEALTRVRERFGVVFQNSALFDGMSVFDNVAFPLRERHPHMREAEVARIVRSRLHLFELDAVEAELPEALSGGMRKRVALARAVVLDPRIVLYDEPTTGLDPLLTESVAHLIVRARQQLGVTSVVICQDLAAAFEIADQMAFLDQGRIRVKGTPQQLRHSQDPHLREFLSLWETTRESALQEAPGRPPGST